MNEEEIVLERLAIFLVRRRVAVILVVAAVTLVFMHFMYELRINENFEECSGCIIFKTGSPGFPVVPVDL